MEKQLQGRHVFLIISSFFLVMFLVNGVFIWRAVATFPGEEVEKSYLQGIHYNETLEQRAIQAELGWGAEVGVDGQDGGQIMVRMLDQAGSPIGNLDLNVRQHKIGQSAAEAYALRSIAPGVYAAALPEGSAGRLEFVVEARRRGEDDLIFTAHKTLVAP